MTPVGSFAMPGHWMMSRRPLLKAHTFKKPQQWKGKRADWKKTIAIGCMLAATAIGVRGVSAAKPPASRGAALSEAGEKFLARYSETLAALRAEISKAVPAVNERKKAALQEAREAVRKATAEANAAQQALNQIQGAKGLVDHAKGKWIGGADKGIAAAEAALKKAGTDAEREAAKKELAKWQANREDGVKALKERQEAYDKAKRDEPRLTDANRKAQAAMAQAQANELAAAKAILADLQPFLSQDKLDAKLVTCAVLLEATPNGLAEFAQQGKEQEALVEKLLADEALMKQMLVAGGANAGKYGQAMQIYTAIRKASPKAGEGLFQRLALAVSLEHAVPIAQGNPKAQTDAPATVDPVKRYLHYEKACLDGELDPAFKDLAAWEYRNVVNGDEPDQILAWGREMLRNYRPDHVLNPDYGWRYSGAVRTDVKYGSQDVKNDKPSLQNYQNIILNGGVCGRRAFFGRFILRSFGIPTAARPQVGHAALVHWTPKGWVVNLGAGFGCPEAKGILGMTDADFLVETQVRKHPKEHEKSLRAEWIGQALGEQKYTASPKGNSGTWSLLAHFGKKVVVAETKPQQLAALGTELGEANESAETKAAAVVKATVTEADNKVVVAPNGVITIPAAACGDVQPMKSFLGGLQAFCGRAFTCRVDVPSAGKYRLTARVVTVHDESQVQLTNNGKDPVTAVIPYTCGRWEQTKPVEVTLVQGKNVLSFAIPARGFTLKDITLTPVR